MLHKLKMLQEARRYSRFQARFATDFSFTQACQQYPDRGDLYAYMHHYLHHLAPPAIRKHRKYFCKEARGFGEDALHSMWFTMLREFRPVRCLEIGVYRGQVLTLWGVVAREISYSCSIHGISPFSSVGDNVSNYSDDIDYYSDTLEFHRVFNLSEPNLLRALSTDRTAFDYIMAESWDLIYIDGNHDYDVALSDYFLCRDALSSGGLLVMDDSSLGTSYKPLSFSFAGHPGPSRVVQERAMNEMNFLGGVGHNNVFRKL